MAGRLKTFQQNIFLLIGSIVVAAVIAEVVLRIALPSPIIWKYPQESYQYDPEIGHWLKPNQQAFTHDKPVNTNSLGIRDSEYASVAPDNVYRILALGDSQTFGNGLVLADTWPKQLERKLNNTQNDVRYDVLNSGLASSDTWQHEIILQRMLANYHPDAVVLAFYVNDVVKRFTPNPNRHDNGNTFRSRVGYVLKQSALLLTLRTVIKSIRQSISPGKAFLNQQALLNGEDNPLLHERWDQVEKSLSTMKKISDNQNVAFMIASLPRRDQVDGRLSWESYNKHIQVVADRYHIPTISMLEPLQESYKEHGKNLFIPWDGHNSRIANNVIAHEIASLILTSVQRNQ